MENRERGRSEADCVPEEALTSEMKEDQEMKLEFLEEYWLKYWKYSKNSEEHQGKSAQEFWFSVLVLLKYTTQFLSALTWDPKFCMEIPNSKQSLLIQLHSIHSVTGLKKKIKKKRWKLVCL